MDLLARLVVAPPQFTRVYQPAPAPGFVPDSHPATPLKMKISGSKHCSEEEAHTYVCKAVTGV